MYKVNFDLLWHFHCEECHFRFTLIGNIPPMKSVQLFCPNCGRKDVVKTIADTLLEIVDDKAIKNQKDCLNSKQQVIEKVDEDNL